MTIDDWDSVAAYALTLPETETSTSYGQPAIKVRGRMFVSTGHEAGSFHVRSPHDEKAVLIETDPDTFWQTPHYARWPGLLVRYASADPDRVRIVIARAWHDQAPPRLRKDHGDRPDRFTRFAAIDWSGAAGPRQGGIAVVTCARGDAAPELVAAPGGGVWSREAVLGWLEAQVDAPILIGLDLSPGFPFVDAGAYFPGWAESPRDAKALWRLVETLSHDDPHLSAGGFLRHGEAARHFRQQGVTGDLFPGGRGRLRRCEEAQRTMRLSPSSCLNLIGAAQVGKSSLTGMRVLDRLGGRIPIWPFDRLPADGPAIVEIYTSLAARAAGMRAGLSKMRDAAALDTALRALGSRAHAALPRYDDHATDALLTAAWLRRVSDDAALWHPSGLTEMIAVTEGWTFGVP